MSATTTRTSDCRKFSPNIFNKSKCSHCFRQREEHSAAALECNRASRKVSKCGYLFVAPDWDFTNPLYRTKRWQRRWFVLYDDGELTYSVDEHPETVPQACIDMTKVLEVATAEDVTGHTNSIAITAPDRITFVKGTCHEESKWWLNVLSAFPKSKGRHKRNATFPGGQATTMLQISSDAKARNRHNSYHKETLTSVQSAGAFISRSSDIDADNDCRRELWQCANETVVAANDKNIKSDNNEDADDDDDDDDGVETGEDEDEEEDADDVEENQKIIDRNKKSLSTTNTAGTTQVEYSQNAGNEISNTACLLRDDVRQDEKTIKDIANTITNLSQQQKNRWSTATVNNVLNSHLRQTNLSKNDKSSRDETDFVRAPKLTQQQGTTTTTSNNNRPKSLPLASNSTPAIVSAIVKRIPPVLATTTNTASTEGTNNNNNNNSSSTDIRVNANQKIFKNGKSGVNLQLQIKHLQRKYLGNQQQLQKQQQSATHHHERGDPDGGCNLDELSSSYLAQNAELRLSSKAEESLNTKKGWLMKQENRTGDWTKHWFTLNGAALFYYRDPISEERGVLDGVLDVNSLTNVSEVNSSKSYAFQLTTWDKQRLILASLSPNSRNSWIAVLRNAVGLPLLANNAVSNTVPNETEQIKVPTTATNTMSKRNETCAVAEDSKSEIERDFINAQKNHESCNSSNISRTNRKTSNKSIDSSRQITFPPANNVAVKTANSSNTPSPKILKSSNFSSDEEYRTASESGRRDSLEWGSPLSPLPPTHAHAPKNSTTPSIEVTKPERMRPRSMNYPSRLYKRSRSSPPNSRYSSIDSTFAEELPMKMLSEHEELLSADKELQCRLSLAEKERDVLRDEAKVREQRMTELLSTLERTEQELNSRIQEMEHVRENLSAQLENAQRNADDIITHLKEKLENNQIHIKNLEDRLASGIEENEALYKRLREIEGCSPNFTHLQRNKFKRMDSLSDLTQVSDIDPYGLERNALAEEYNELKSRFEKAVNEIRAMKRELKESQNQFDSLEISYASLKQDQERREMADRAQLEMMAARIQDLTLKYSSSERQVRMLKQKLSKSERRRSLSLKSKDQITVSKELEEKVVELEAKIDEMEKSTIEYKSASPVQQATAEICKSQSKKATRRRSLESHGTNDALQFMVKVNDLEKRFDTVSLSSSISRSSTPTPTSSTQTLPISSKVSEHLLERLRCLENVLITSKDRLEQGLQQLQSLRSTRTRRSVSPITDRKESYRLVERCLSEVVKLIRESCETCVISGSAHHGNAANALALPESSPVKKSLSQLETQLRNKLADLLKQRRMLRERNELTSQKHLELLAERIAFESVCFGKLHDSIQRAEHPELFRVRQARAEVTETSHLISMLKAKLSGKCVLKPSGTLDILAGVLARRLLLSSYHSNEQGTRAGMLPIDQNILDDLMRQHNEVNVIIKRYKNHAMEALASGLAAETLSYISTNDLVQGAVQEAWRQAQETVNAELVQSEIAQIMMRNAERLEHSLAPSFGYALTPEERVSFEKFADAVHDALRQEMELDVENLTRRYEEAMQKIKRGQWRLHLNEDRKASESRQLLAEFADIMAHKALIDARIAVLRGEYVGTIGAANTASQSKIGITALQKYETLFEELSNDLQIENADDILAEADFEFIYKQQTIDFLTDRQVLAEISTFLGQLEDSLIALQCEATAESTIPRTAISIESLQDVCHKCCDLRQRAQQLLHEVQIKLSTPCQHCLQVREKLCSLQQQHENELLRLQQTHAKDMNMLLQQVEHQRNALQHIETEKSAINSDLHKSEELIEQRERELVAIKNVLQAKEEELRCQHSDHFQLLQRLHEQENTLQALGTECDALRLQCQHQEEKYVRLMREHNYLQNDLIKEKESSRRSEKRLELLESEHSKQLECLQQAYHEQLLTHCSEFSSNSAADEESFRQRYQVEIEQLKTLCEKGLSAMESSHRRIVNDLEEKHKQEIERLLLDKETALAEETQATLAALDAMRKAHQSEVQREVARFKQEFLKQFQKNEHIQGSTRAKEEELEELRQEILSFSEKYSTKCVENAALEEKLRVTTQKLRHFQQMQQMEIRNKQFRAHLASEDPTTDANFVQGLITSKEDDALCRDSENTLAQVSSTLTASRSTATDENTKNLQHNLLHRANSCEDSKETTTEFTAATETAAKSNLNTSDDHNTLFEYEPCYKQANLSIHNRINFEGLKPTTTIFCRDLKSTKKSKSTTAAALHATSADTPTITQKIAALKPNEKNSNKLNYYEKYLQRRSKLKKDFLNPSIKTALSIQPVEQPKIQSTKNINVNTSSLVVNNLVSIEEPTQQTMHLVNQKSTNSNNAKTNDISQLKHTAASASSNHNSVINVKTAAPNANITITERCAINLNSFSDIVRNTTMAAVKAKTKAALVSGAIADKTCAEKAAITTNDFVKSVVDDLQ